MSPAYSGAITVMQKDGDHCAEAIGSVREILQGLADAGHALSEMLRRIAEAHGSLVGFLWIIDQSAGILRLTESWYSPAAPAATTFIETNKTLTFARGRGLPGRVWASGNASWVTSIA